MIKFILFVLALLPASANADPATIGYVSQAFATFMSNWGAYVYAAMAAVSVYGATNARRKMRAEAARQRAEYNSSLTDRSQSLLSPNPPHRVIYGRAVTGGDVIAIFTTDKEGIDADGIAYTKPDAYKHLVVHIASHEIESIEEIFIDGIPLGALDSNGDVVNTSWGTAKSFVTGTALTRGATSIPVVSGTGTILVNDEISFPGETKRYKVLVGTDGPGTITIAAPGLINNIPLGSAVNLGNEFNRNTHVARKVEIPIGDSVTVPYAVDQVLQAGNFDPALTGGDQTWIDVVPVISGDGLTITNPSTTMPIVVTYSTRTRASSVRIKKHLGSDTQTVDTYLNGLVPLQWTADHRLRGLAYVVVTVDLEEPLFQAWTPSGITFDVKGRKVFDPRTSTTAWSDNAALCIRDYLLAPWGFECAEADINSAQAIAAINACDELVDLTVGTETLTNQKRFTVNGVFTTSDAVENVLADLSTAMAGDTVYGAQWMIQPGVWTAPVTLPDGRDELTDDDLDGAIAIVQAGEGLETLFNGVRGNFIPAGRSSPVDFEPYQNSTFVTADGRPLWTNVDLPYTDNKARAKNICRILTEKNRDGLVIQYPAKLIAWPLTLGDRIRVTSSEMGWNRKIFRVTDWQFGITAPVNLTLQEDTEAAYDEADAASADPSPNSNLVNPGRVTPIKNLAATSGNATVLILKDGTVVPRVKLSWSAITDPYIADGTGYVMVGVLSPGAAGWVLNRVPGSATSAMITGVKEGDTVALGAYAVNGVGVKGEAVFISHKVIGKTDAPSDVTNLAFSIKPGLVAVTWDPCEDSDYASTELRAGETTDTWETATLLWKGVGTEYHHPRPANGVYRVFGRHLDTSGNYSDNVSFIDVTVTDSIDPGAGESVIVEYSVNGTTGWHSTFAPGDIYARWKVGVSGDWQGPWKIVGEAGASGNYVDFIFIRSATQPATPTGASPAGWSDSPPAPNGNPLWASTAEKTSAGVLIGVWSTPVQIEGAAGDKVAMVYIYQRAASSPPLPSNVATYSFSSNQVFGMNNGWTATIPAGSNPLWVTAATAVATGTSTTDNIAAAEWASPVIMVQDGAAGAKSATVFIYQRTTTASAPTVPTVDATYTFSGGSTTGLNNGWSSTIPSSGGSYLWVTQATALSSGTTDTISSGEWSAVRLLAQNGADGSGTQGASARRAYALFTGNPVVSGSTVQTSGSTSLPSTAAWSPSSATSWTSTTQTPASGQAMFQTDGTYDPVTGLTTWQVPYLSNLKVGDLSVLGNMTGGVIRTAASGARIELSGVTFKVVNSSEQNVITIDNTGKAEFAGGTFDATRGIYAALIGRAGTGTNSSTAVGVHGIGNGTLERFGVLGEVTTSTTSSAAAGVYAYADSNAAALRARNDNVGYAANIQGSTLMHKRLTFLSVLTDTPIVLPVLASKPSPVAGGVALTSSLGLIFSNGSVWYGIVPGTTGWQVV